MALAVLTGCASSSDLRWQHDPFYVGVHEADLIFVGALTRTDEAPDQSGRPGYHALSRWRTSTIEVDRVLYGPTSLDSLRLVWFGGIQMCGGARPATDYVMRDGLWFIRNIDGRWRARPAPLMLDDVSTEELRGFIASLDKAPREYWHEHLRPGEIREAEMPILAVRNFLDKALQSRSNNGLQPTSPVVTPLVPSGAPRPSARARG